MWVAPRKRAELRGSQCGGGRGFERGRVDARFEMLAAPPPSASPTFVQPCDCLRVIKRILQLPWAKIRAFNSGCKLTAQSRFTCICDAEVGVTFPNKQRQHRTLHIQKDVLAMVLVTVPRVSHSRCRLLAQSPSLWAHLFGAPGL